MRSDGLGRAAASYDVVVIGGGPGGSAAALSAQQNGLAVLLLEAGKTPRPPACAAWLGPAGIKACQACGVDAEKLGVAFSGLRLRSWDLRQCVEVKDREVKGVVVRPATLSQKLLEAAQAAGVDVRRGVSGRELRLEEQCVTVQLSDTRSVRARVVVIADGAASLSAAMARLSPARQVPLAAGCALAAFETKKPGVGLDVILGAGRSVRLAVIARGRDEIRVAVSSRGEAASQTGETPVPPAELLGPLVAAAKAAGVLPREFDAAPQEQVGLAGVALDMETHVGKRCLLVGDAGGFVSAFSGEGIYPALRSGMLAGQIVARALRAAVLQDELAGFDAFWRADLADYLRMPNTDLGLLLPMVFGNAQMSKRVARAFLLGKPL